MMAGELGSRSGTNRVRRHPERGRYESGDIYPIVDEAIHCHLGVVVDGAPLVVPTVHARIGDVLYLHGAVAAKSLRAVGHPIPCCVTVTLVDGLVLARSAFNHSLNYRSVIVQGQGAEVADPEEKLGALQALVEHIAPGRWADVRPPSPTEFRTTLVMRVSLRDAVAKVRTGPVVDDPEDMDWPGWAGIVPLAVQAGSAEPDAGIPMGLPLPLYLSPYRRA
jgi:nitroimidazol reductase NimA-like FMN-containing flavoprotein (pyridoxamine 5'-phosphate oxidase superfamily)